MQGINAKTGKHLDGIEHFKQSIRDILTTPIGSRVMRRDYGSRIMSIIDNPINDETVLDLYTAAAEALNTWEPRLKLESIQATTSEAGKLSLTIYGVYLPDGIPVTVEGIGA